MKYYLINLYKILKSKNIFKTVEYKIKENNDNLNKIIDINS